MKMLIRICIGLVLFFVAVSAGSEDNIITPSPPIQPSGSTSTPSPSPPTPPTTTSTEKPTTTSTEKPTTTSTQKPTTTSTEKPTTTSTEKPTTTSTEKPTTTSTEKPTTTSTEKPTPGPTPVPPTPAPAPQPIPGSNGVWNVTETVNNTSTACIVASMKVRIGVPYVSHVVNSTNLVNSTRVLHVPDNATATGTCGNTTHQSLKLSWVESKTTMSIEFGFVQNKTAGFTLSSVNVTIPATPDVFPNIAGNQTVFILVSQNTSLPPTPAAKSYKCFTGLPLTLTDLTPAKNITEVTVATLNLTHVQFEAFAHATKNNFGAAVECAGDAFITPDIVPIAVGVALAALVAVVLVAYVIGRRRSNASGYLSM